jgi:DNA-directed RNA polymerase specialized sigma24 family protein
MLGPDLSFGASWAFSAPLTQAAFPPQAYAPPRGGNGEPWIDQRASYQCPAHHRSRTARDGFQSRSTIMEKAQSAQQLGAVGHLNSGSSPGTDQQLRSLIADAMRQLPFEHRAVIYRAYYQRWTTARIAHDLKITEAAVKSRLHDGLHALRLTGGARPN